MTKPNTIAVVRKWINAPEIVLVLGGGVIVASVFLVDMLAR